MPKQAAKTKKSKVNFQKETSYLFISVGIVFLLLLATHNLNHFLKENAVLGVSTEKQCSRNEIVFWEVFLYDNRNYLNGWYELAQLRLNEGNFTGANEALMEIERISPNSEMLVKLRSAL